MEKNNSTTTGKLITIEGIDGCGKTLLFNNLKKHFSPKNTIFTREPGGTKLGDKLRKILQDEKKTTCDISEFLLFAAARAQHFEKIIIPSITSGKNVISDRCADSSLAYQGYGRGLDIETIEKINQWAMQEIIPDITIYIKIDAKTAFERIVKRNEKLTAFEKEKKEFWTKVIEGYKQIFSTAKNRHIIEVDGTQDPEKISEYVMQQLEKQFRK